MKLVRFFLIVLLPLMAFSASAQENGSARQRLILEARLSANSPVLEDGVEWRIFNAISEPDADLNLLASAYGGAKTFEVTAGEYLVHAAYGHAGAVKRVVVGDGQIKEEFNLNAGGLKLTAIASQNTPIPARLLRFDVYSPINEATDQRRLLARNIKPSQVVAFPVGTYHVVSRFGNLNAEIRADLRVQSGKVTDARLTHRAAIVTFRLVRTEGGDAIADTAWSILTESGDVIEESTSTFPTMVLAEGNYSAIAKHNEMIYSNNFTIRSGINRDVEVIAEN